MRRFTSDDLDQPTPAHDAICEWLHDWLHDGDNFQGICAKFFGEERARFDAMHAHPRKPVSGIEVPARPAWPGFELDYIEWELPIKRGDYIAAFIDLSVGIRIPFVSLEEQGKRTPEGFKVTGYEWKRGFHPMAVSFEVKPTVPSVGSLLRQVRRYSALGVHHIIIVTPQNDRVDRIFEKVGLRVLWCPELGAPELAA
jgi:hypothetical protein